MSADVAPAAQQVAGAAQQPGAPLIPAPPRVVWPTIGWVVLAVGLGIVLQFLVLFLLGAILRESGGTLESGTAFVVTILPTEFAMLIVALAAAARLPGRMRDKLGLVPAGLPWWAYAAFVLGTFAVATLGQWMSHVLVYLGYTPPFDVQGIRAAMSPGEAALFVVLIGLLPGVAEELLFRGYVQRRLLSHERPSAAIGLSTVLFSLSHVEPLHVVFAAPIGAWLGIVAWRTGSVWPALVCHLSLNSVWNAYLIMAAQWQTPEHVLEMSASLGLAASILGLLASIVLLGRMRQPAQWPVVQSPGKSSALETPPAELEL